MLMDTGFLWGMRKVLQLVVVRLHNPVNILKPLVCMFERYIVSYMNYINKAVIKKRKSVSFAINRMKSQMQDY